MKLSDIKGEAALEALADIIDPAVEILADAEMVKAFRTKPKIQIIKMAIKRHKRAVLAIMAALEGETPETYEVSFVTLPAKMLELFSDPQLVSLFHSQSQTATSSGSATENTEGEEK